MIQSLYLAYRYILFHKIKTIILLASITLIIYLPIGLNILVNRSEIQLMERASSTPPIIGARGSSLDLVINTLYFETASFEEISMLDAERVEQTNFAIPIPMYVKFQARKLPIVGTTLDYFDFRGLEIERGENLAILGDCVLGANVAKALGLKPGDSLISSPENVLDIAGVYPLKMSIVGVLKTSHTPDDNAIFTDLKTTWVIKGLGHGHEDIDKIKDPTVLLGVEGKRFIASAKLYQYNVITAENLGEFHFHGDPANYPITAVITVPNSKKYEALLMGRYLSKDETSQIVNPQKVIKNLLAGIFKIKRFLDSVFLIVAISTLLLFGLVIMLSLQIRQREIQTMYKIGSSRFKITELLAFEILIVLLISMCLSGSLILVTSNYVDEFIKLFIL